MPLMECINNIIKGIMNILNSTKNQNKNNTSDIIEQIPSKTEKTKNLSEDIALKTKSSKLVNEDSFGYFKGNFCSVVAIADGVGSSTDAHIASNMAVSNFIEEVKSFDCNHKEPEFEDIMKFWVQTAEKMKIFYETNKEKYKDKSNVLLTTLIILIECKDRYLISYLGNGSIWHVRGDFWHFWNSSVPLPWCMSDLMLGHANPENGQTPLYGFLGTDGDISKVSHLAILKNNFCGEIFILTTDGISSPDNLKTGSDSNQKLWVEVNSHIQNLIYKSLADYFKSFSRIERNDNLILNEIIERFLKEKTFDDDATVGVIISNKAKEYYLSKMRS